MKKLACFVLFIFCLSPIDAQNTDLYSTGHLTGSYETYTQYYLDDSKIKASAPADKIGSNNFLKLDYNYKQFVAGIQYESYLPSIQNYFSRNPLEGENGSKLVNKYFQYNDKKFSILVGDFYEQFGNGLIFRSWENRPIGINNALEGINISVRPTDFIKVKILSGQTRDVFDFSNSTVQGADAEVDLSKWVNKKDASNPINLSVGGSYISRFEGGYTGPIPSFPETVNADAVRLNLDANSFSFNIEYASKTADPHVLNNQSFSTGNAILINTSYTKNNLGITLTGRSLNNMDFRSEREVVSQNANQLMVNYLPALTKQHDYLTSNIYVYSAQALDETGGQADIFYNFKEGKAIGGKYGLKATANISYYGELKNQSSLIGAGPDTYYKDINFELKKKWSKKLETTLALQQILYNQTILGNPGPDITSNIVAVSSLYKYTKKKSMRFVLENLATKQDGGNWAAGVAEFSFAPVYSFYFSDLWNYGTKGVSYYGAANGINSSVHYFNIGGSIAKNATRFSLAFGRQRAGLFCVGGVCRLVPASYGFTATLTTSFGN